ATDQRATLPSLPHEARVLPSGLTERARHQPVCALIDWRGAGFSSAAFQTCTFPVQSAEKRVLPSFEKARARTQLLWPSKAVFLPVSISKRWTLLSWAPAKTYLPVGSMRQPTSALLCL